MVSNIGGWNYLADKKKNISIIKRNNTKTC